HTNPTYLYPLSLHDALPILRTMLRIKDHAFWFSFVGSDPTRIQFLDSTGPRIIPSYLNRVLCAPGVARPSRAGTARVKAQITARSEEHTSELQSRFDLVCRL